MTSLLHHFLAVAAGFLAHHAAIAVPAGDIIADAAQAAAEAFRKLVPRAPQSSLQRIFRHTELLRGFASGISLHFAKHKRGAQERRELVQILADYFAQLRTLKHLLGIRPFGGEA